MHYATKSHFLWFTLGRMIVMRILKKNLALKKLTLKP